MPGLPPMIAALMAPEAYPEATRRVELAQTQMSFVFLADEYVYKIKKPVDLGYLDYTTLEKRLFYCRKETELNRRLCPEAYLGVVPVTRSRDGFTIGGNAEIAEYAVKMRRLPREAMLDVRLAEDRVSPEMLAGVAQRLAAFHREAETNDDIGAFGDLEMIARNTGENFTQTESHIGDTITREGYERIRTYNDSFLARNTPLFHRRVREGRIRDCHGDLHAAHICLTDTICIYDCIEFNDRFRYGDVAAEVAFLAMDLDHYGRADLSGSFVNAYTAASGDGGLQEILNFYKCYRAYVRGKVEGFKLNDPHIAAEEKAQILAAARDYFELAEDYIQ